MFTKQNLVHVMNIFNAGVLNRRHRTQNFICRYIVLRLRNVALLVSIKIKVDNYCSLAWRAWFISLYGYLSVLLVSKKRMQKYDAY